MKLELDGKRALITGSTSGIGKGIATTLAAEGASIVVHGRDADRAEEVAHTIRSAGGKAAVALGDLSHEDGAVQVADLAQKAFGGIDILVNNVGGVMRPSGEGDWFSSSSQDWADVFEKNVGAPARMIRLLAPGMRDNGWGRLIHIGTTAATSPNLGPPPEYPAAKAAVINMSLLLSKALSGTGVTTNVVSPGMISTPSIDQWFAMLGEIHGWGDDRAKSEAYVLENFVPQTVKRIGQVSDIANMVAYLASPLADFITGANFRVDGGISPSIN